MQRMSLHEMKQRSMESENMTSQQKNKNIEQYIGSDLSTKSELDADILSVACALAGPTRKEDVVPRLMNRKEWFAAKDLALAEGWIIKDPTGPTNRGARYLSRNSTVQQLEEANMFEQMGLSPFDYAAEQHLQQVRSLLDSNPGKAFNAWDLRRGRGGPCTTATWPYVKDALVRDGEIDLAGTKRARTYTLVPLLWRMEERVMQLENALSSVLFTLLSATLSIDEDAGVDA